MSWELMSFICHPLHFRLAEESEDPLSSRSQNNRRAEQELHEMSEKLARRLGELDLVSVLRA